MPKDSVRQKKTGKQVSTQLYLPFAEIRDDTVVLKNGGARAILQSSSVNFNLKSEAEQNAIIYGYQSFLNTLEFPIQILVKSHKLDVTKYLDHMRGLAEEQLNPLLRKQTYEYAEYVKKLVEYADIMEKRFYVIVPYDLPGTTSTNMFTKFISSLSSSDSVSKMRERHKRFFEMKKMLNHRVNLVTAGLEQSGLRIKQLNTQEIIELLYNTYNPVTSMNERINNVDDINTKIV